MCLDARRNVGAESEVMLLAVVTPREMHEVDRADDVSVPPVIEEAH